jgi:hypothetical protein
MCTHFTYSTNCTLSYTHCAFYVRAHAFVSVRTIKNSADVRVCAHMLLCAIILRTHRVGVHARVQLSCAQSLPHKWCVIIIASWVVIRPISPLWPCRWREGCTRQTVLCWLLYICAHYTVCVFTYAAFECPARVPMIILASHRHTLGKATKFNEPYIMLTGLSCDFGSNECALCSL